MVALLMMLTEHWMSRKEDDIPTIYHFEGSRGFRIVWLCEELAIPYKLVFRPRDQMGSLMALRAINPLMPMAPVVRYGGQLLVESGAIADILLAIHGKGRLIPPIGSTDFLFHTQWMHFAEGTALARMTSERFVAMATGTEVDKLPKGYRAGSDNTVFAPIGSTAVLEYASDFLGSHPHFGGAEFTAADIMMEYALRVAKLVVWADSNEFPHVADWRKRMESRAAYKRAKEAATPGPCDEYGIPVHSPHPFTRPQSANQ
jgi:glutathione S-transferase